MMVIARSSPHTIASTSPFTLSRIGSRLTLQHPFDLIDISDPWFIGECVYSCGNLPLTAPFETFGDFVNAFSNQQHLSSVTNDTGGLRFIFTVDGKAFWNIL